MCVALYRQVGAVDACICAAESGALDNFESLTDVDRKHRGEGIGSALVNHAMKLPALLNAVCFRGD